MLSRHLKKEVLNQILTFLLQISILEGSAVNTILEVISRFLGHTRISSEVHSHQTLRTSQSSSQLNDHIFVESSVTEIQMNKVIVVLNYSQQVVKQMLCIIIQLFFLGLSLVHHVICSCEHGGI